MSALQRHFSFQRSSRRVWGGILLVITSVASVAGVVLAVSYWRHEFPWRPWSAQERTEKEALARARVYLEHAQAPQAIRVVSLIKAGSPHEAEALTITGLALAALEETGPARQTLERAWRLRPSGDAAKVLAAIYLSAYENERGLQMLIEASRLDPADFRPWYAMGESVYLRLHRHELAIEAFRKSLLRRPDHTESRIGLLDAFVSSHRDDEAAALFEQVLKERPDDPRVLTLGAELAIESGDDDRAAGFLTHALGVDPEDRKGLLLHARLLFRHGRRQEALPEAEQARRLDPNDLSALTLLSSVQASLGLREEARQTLAHKREVQQRAEMMEKLQQSIRDHPHDPEPRWRLGQLAAEADMRPLAIQSFQAALAQAPDFEPARKALLDLGFPPARLPPAPRSALSSRSP